MATLTIQQIESGANDLVEFITLGKNNDVTALEAVQMFLEGLPADVKLADIKTIVKLAVQKQCGTLTKGQPEGK